MSFVEYIFGGMRNLGHKVRASEAHRVAIAVKKPYSPKVLAALDEVARTQIELAEKRVVDAVAPIERRIKTGLPKRAQDADEWKASVELLEYSYLQHALAPDAREAKRYSLDFAENARLHIFKQLRLGEEIER